MAACITPRIISVMPLEPSVLGVRYENGESRIADIASTFRGSFMGRLADEPYFNLVRVIHDGETVGWPEGQDIDPCWLYEVGTPAAR